MLTCGFEQSICNDPFVLLELFQSSKLEQKICESVSLFRIFTKYVILNNNFLKP